MNGHNNIDARAYEDLEIYLSILCFGSFPRVSRWVDDSNDVWSISPQYVYY